LICTVVLLGPIPIPFVSKLAAFALGLLAFTLVVVGLCALWLRSAAKHD
jgi:uncharacterized membrane protein